ncbi:MULTISPECIES: metal-dependent hydrolase [Paenibacillus]|uniref:metal-dependent hydrolase n=1 Tax=Paenibacillus TaxID=44249 RepID=UPI00204196F6|nr:metal-dependent hydrolase [Paenibacillus camelliae]MCM3635999.1 metal-dependent hydrolase [Paenibacillus camelliae]
MNGKTHLTIGAVIGGIYGLVHAPAGELDTILFFAGIGGFSGLAADLDGPSVLTRKLTKVSRILHTSLIVVGLSSLLLLGWLTYTQASFRPDWLLAAFAASIVATLLGLLVSRGFWRNALVSLVGIMLAVYGFDQGWYWLIGLGAFVIIAPWLSHRGLTHTIWIVPIWGWIGFGLEQQLGIDGIGIASMLTYLSHIVADMFTPAGVKVLYPITKKKFKLKL